MLDNKLESIAKLSTQSVADAVSNQLQQMILGGSLKPGEKLPSERALSSDFNVSRMSLRQGITLLVDTGLLIVKKDGTYVCDVISHSLVKPFEDLVKWYPQALEDMLDLRLLLETAALQLSMSRMSQSDKKVINFFYQEMQLAFSSKGKHLVMSKVTDFHLAIIDCSYNLALSTVLRGILSLTLSAYDKQPNIAHLAEFELIQTRLHQSIMHGDLDTSKEMITRHIDFIKSSQQGEHSDSHTDNDSSFHIDKAIARIEYLLICGHLESGEALPNKTLIAKQINEEADTVDTALTLLVERGSLTRKGDNLFANKQNKQTLINDPLVYLMDTDTRVAYDVLELRILLEQNAAAQAAKNPSSEKRSYLKNCLIKLLSHNDDPNHYANAIDDYEFHLAIADMTTNLAHSYLMRGLFNLLRASISKWLALFDKEIGDISIIQKQHMDICESILSSNPEAASEAMREHLQYVITTMRDIYARKEREIHAQQRWEYLSVKFKIKDD
ncbi:MAG: FCD domain-containing protein [Arenicella sp.]